MKKLIFVAIVSSLFFAGCEYGDTEKHDPLENIQVGQKDDYFFENDIQLSSVHKIGFYIDSIIDYKDEVTDYWQLPEETIKLGTGDCEDFCILWMYLAKTKFGIDSYLTIVKNGNECHALIYAPLGYDGNMYYYDPTTNSCGFSNLPSGWYEYCKIPYNEVIWMTYYYHNNVGVYY